MNVFRSIWGTLCDDWRALLAAITLTGKNSPGVDFFEINYQIPVKFKQVEVNKFQP